MEQRASLRVIGLAVGQIAVVGRVRRSVGLRAREGQARFELVAQRIAEPNALTLVDPTE